MTKISTINIVLTGLSYFHSIKGEPQWIIESSLGPPHQQCNFVTHQHIRYMLFFYFALNLYHYLFKLKFYEISLKVLENYWWYGLLTKKLIVINNQQSSKQVEK